MLDAEDYRTVVADPPWQPTLGASWDSRMRDKAGPQRFYDTLSTPNIIALRPRMATQAHLYLWCLTAHVDWAYDVARAWECEPITLLTWKKPGLGAGRFRCNTEHVLVARKGPRAGNPFGQGGRHAQATNGTLFEWSRGRHSAKPKEFFDLVERLSPAPRLEMYARGPRQGWSVWGNQSNGNCNGPKSPSREAIKRTSKANKGADYGADI
jgi:N6-adenosine-specific RNA methylase IME4